MCLKMNFKENLNDIKNVFSVLNDTIKYKFKENGSNYDAALNENLERIWKNVNSTMINWGCKCSKYLSLDT